MTADTPTSPNRDLLDSLARGHDRDKARFFTGRKQEAASVEGAVADARNLGVPQFRIFQGAPGSGKSSLLSHLRDQPSENRVYIEVDHECVTSGEKLRQYVDGELRRSNKLIAKLVGAFIKQAGAATEVVVPGVGASAAAKATSPHVEQAMETVLDTRQRRRIQDEVVIVLTCDEAQLLDESHRTTLNTLHTTGLRKLKTVVLFAGLGHTKSTLSHKCKLSRPALNATLVMGELSHDECVESTRMMLDHCRIAGDDRLKTEVAQTVAKLSHGWPQHLGCAQSALARELIRVDCDLSEIDGETVERETTAARYEYYRGRIEDHPVLGEPEFTARVVRVVHQERPRTTRQLGLACRQTLDSEPADSPMREDPPAPMEVAHALIEKGVLTKPNDGPYRVAIPSMATWLDSHSPAGERAT